MRKLQDDLDYWNMQLRLAKRQLDGTKAKVREIENKIEELKSMKE